MNLPPWGNLSLAGLSGVVAVVSGIGVMNHTNPVDGVVFVLAGWSTLKNLSIASATRRVIREHGSVDHLKTKIASKERELAVMKTRAAANLCLHCGQPMSAERCASCGWERRFNG